MSTYSAGDAGAETRIGGEGASTWPELVDRAVSHGVATGVAEEATEVVVGAQAAEAFEALRLRVAAVVKPVLDRCAETMKVWGLETSVSAGMRDTPPRMHRCYDLALHLQKYEGKGPGRLTITAIEGRDLLHIVLRIGPAAIGGRVSEHDGLVQVGDLTEDMIGGLVATMVEELFR